MRRRAGTAIGVLGIALMTISPGGRAPASIPSTFRFDLDARPELHRLWDASVAAKAERVGCLAATIGGDTVEISQVFPLQPGPADSLGISASRPWRTVARPSGGVRCTPTWRSGTVFIPTRFFPEPIAES